MCSGSWLKTRVGETQILIDFQGIPQNGFSCIVVTLPIMHILVFKALGTEGLGPYKNYKLVSYLFWDLNINLVTLIIDSLTEMT